MTTIQSKDFIQIRLAALISSQDFEYLAEFYGPIIGLDAIGLYVSMKQYDGLLDQEAVQVEGWLTQLQTSPHQFHQARLQLEGLGLLRTHQHQYQETKMYTLSLYAPKPPHDFLSDPILRGLLLQRIGEVALKRLETKYVLSAFGQAAQDVSASFGEVFHPDLHHPAFVLASTGHIKGKTLAEIRQPFDRLRFAEQLKNEFSLSIEKLNPADIETALTMATLVGLDEIALANLVGTHLDANHRLMLTSFEHAARTEKRLPFIRQRQQQKYQFQETSNQAILVNQMEMMTPVDFLTQKQRGAEISPADFSLLIRLQQQYHLTNPVINALLHHVLTTQNNVLSSRYVEKLAGSLSRENLAHAADTLDYFLQLSLPKSNKPSRPKPPETSEEQEQKVSETDPSVNEEELAALEKQVKGLK